MNTVVAHVPSSLPTTDESSGSRWSVSGTKTAIYTPEDLMAAKTGAAAVVAVETADTPAESEPVSTRPPAALACVLAALTTMLVATSGMAISAMF